ncbi:MAG: hypothetical protein H6719_25680 [Sandaracinaceae bacterium]|nr:hypothetical protein [Sandaracinaceae bacterium]
MRLAASTLALLLAAAPAAAQEVPDPPAPVDLAPATVRFRANVPDLQVLYMQDPVLDDSGGAIAVRAAPPGRYSELCVAPCDVDLPQTHLGLAVRRRDHLHRFDAPLGVDGPTGVRIDWDDRDLLRLAGVLTLVGGGAVGLSIIAATLALALDDGALAGGLVGGIGLLGAAVTVGVLLVLTEDAASFSVTPLPSSGAQLFSAEWR